MRPIIEEFYACRFDDFEPFRKVLEAPSRSQEEVQRNCIYHKKKKCKLDKKECQVVKYSLCSS